MLEEVWGLIDKAQRRTACFYESGRHTETPRNFRLKSRLGQSSPQEKISLLFAMSAPKSELQDADLRRDSATVEKGKLFKHDIDADEAMKAIAGGSETIVIDDASPVGSPMRQDKPESGKFSLIFLFLECD